MLTILTGTALTIVNTDPNTGATDHILVKSGVSADISGGGRTEMPSSMATGTGKTFTGLGAVSKISEDLNDEPAVIIVCP